MLAGQAPARLASVACLVELLSSAPGEEKVIDCVGKLLAFRQKRRREATPAAPFAIVAASVAEVFAQPS
jgi:hypothetical protein